MKCAVNIKETLSRTVIVDNVESLEEAIEMVEQAYRDNNIILDAEDFSDKEISASDVFDDGIVPDDADVSYYSCLSDYLGKENV